MSFGFSVGDFVATALLIKDIICSLKASGGATSEFQELIRELDGLQNVLDMIGGLDGTSDPSFVIEGLKIAALNCQFELDGFRTKMKKYEAALGQERSAGKLKEGAMKIKWTLMMKKDVQDLRAYLSGHTSSLNLRLSLAGFSTTVAQGEHMRERQLKMDETLQSIQTALMGVKAGLTVQEAVMQENKSMLWTLVRMVSGDILPQLKRLTDIATKVWSSNMEIVSSVSKLEASMPRPDLRHTWAQDPIRFEDALGRVLPVPSEYDWEKLEAIIMAQFSRGPGHEKVFAGEYELFDNSTVLRKDDFRDTGLLPGMSITMAIISLAFAASPNGGKICSACYAWFRSSRTPLPLPHRPPEMNFPLQSKTHPHAVDFLDWRNSLKPSATSECLLTLRSERQKYKNISIYVTELPATPVHDLWHLRVAAPVHDFMRFRALHLSTDSPTISPQPKVPIKAVPASSKSQKPSTAQNTFRSKTGVSLRALMPRLYHSGTAQNTNRSVTAVSLRALVPRDRSKSPLSSPRHSTASVMRPSDDSAPLRTGHAERRDRRFTHWGRHSNEWLFGGSSIREIVKKSSN